MNKVAKKRILIVLAVGGVLASSAGGLYGYRKVRISRHFQSLRAEGMAAAAANDYPLAVSDLRTYLARYNNDAEALGAYCRVRPKVVSADRSHLRETMQALRYYVSLRPDAAEQRRELLDLYLTYNLNTEALDTADRLLASRPDDPELLAARTKALARLRRNGDAVATAQRWAAATPGDSEAQQYRVELMKQTGVNDATIIADVDALVAANPKSIGMRAVRAQALLQAGRVPEAAAALKEAAALPNPTAGELRMLSAAMDRVGLYDESIALLSRLAEMPDAGAHAAENHAFLARRLWERGDNAAFLTFVDQHRDVLDGQPDLLALHGLILKALGKAAEGDADLAKLDAGEHTAVAQAWSALAHDSSGPATVATIQKQIELLNDALVDRPTDAYLTHFLAEAYARTGDQELAVSLWQRAARLAPAWAVPPMRASSVLASQGRFDEAFNLAAMAAARSQRLAAANYIQIWTAAVEAGQRGDGAELLKVLDQAVVQPAGQGWLQVARATVLCRLGRADEARQAIEAALKVDKPGLDQQSLLRLAALSRVHQLKLDDAIEARLRADFGVTADAAMTAFFRLFLAEGKDAALAGFEKTRGSAPAPDARDWRLAEARILDFLRDPKAAESWKQLLGANPDDLEVIESGVSSSSMWKDRAVVDGLIEKLRALAGDRGMAWRLLRARWLIEGSTDDAPDLAATQKASDLLTAVLFSTPDNVAARYWQARCQVRLGNRGSAIEHLLTATRLAPKSGPIALYASRLLQEQGDFVRARELLDRLSTQDLDDPEQSSVAAQLLAQQGKAQQAIELLEQSRGLGMSEQSDLLLALLYQRQGAFEKTEAIISRILQQPTLSTVVFAADYYRARGKADLAEQALQKLYALQLAPGVREMTLADYYVRAGDVAKAEKLSEAATVANPQDVAAWRGLILAQLAGGRKDAATATLERARKAIPGDAALTELASQNTWPLIVQVNDDIFRPIAARLASDPKDDAARQALTIVKSSAGQAPRELAASIRQLASRFPLSEPVQVLAAQLLLNTGQPQEAAAVATTAVQAFPSDEALSRLAAQALLGAGEWSRARSFAQAWRQQAGGDVLAPDLLAALAALQMGSPADAESLLRPHIPFAMDRLERHGDVVQTFAVALYRQGKSAEGEKVVEQAIARRAEFAREWAAAAASSLPVADAEAWLARLDPNAGDGSGKAITARLMLQLAARPDAAPELLSKLKQRLATLESDNGLDAEACSVLGVIADQIGEHERAERFYRRSLADGQARPIVRNNLAMLLLSQNRQLDEAEALASKAVDAAPDAAVYADTLAQVQLAARKPDAARRSIDRALKLDPENPQWRLTSAEVAAAEGHGDVAGEAAEKLLGSSAARQALGTDLKRAESLRDRLGKGAVGLQPSK